MRLTVKGVVDDISGVVLTPSVASESSPVSVTAKTSDPPEALTPAVGPEDTEALKETLAFSGPNVELAIDSFVMPAALKVAVPVGVPDFFQMYSISVPLAALLTSKSRFE